MHEVRVLCIDDDEDTAVLIRGFLSEVPDVRYHVDWLGGYDEGLEGVRAARHDVCLVDYRLGARTGLDLLRATRDAGPPKILLTGAGDRAVDREAMRVGAADYLDKDQMSASLLERSIRYAVERARTEARLRDAQRLASLGELAAGLCHELNNPLSGVIGFAELLEGRITDPGLLEDFRKLRREADRCGRITHNLLSFARRQSPRRQPVHINSLLDDAVGLLAYSIRTSGIRLVRRYDAALPPTRADRSQLLQVFLNIIQNAAHAMADGGTLTIDTRLAVDRIHVAVADTGPGIAPEDLARVFDPFFTTKEVGRGTGLGLSIAYGIVREHGGGIEAASRPGEGATFTVSLPVTGGETRETTRTIRKSTVRPLRILVVDDEESVCETLARMLEAMGHHAHAVHSGVEALRATREETFDCILCDMRMPRMNGEEVFQKLRERDARLAERIIFITGDTLGSNTRRFVSGRVVIEKPFDGRALADALARLNETKEAS